MRIQSAISNMLEKIMKIKYLPLTFLIIYITLSSIYIYKTWSNYEQQSSVRALGLAEAAASFISQENISDLSVDPTDINKPAYHLLKDNLITFKNSNPEISSAYIYTVINDKVYILADSQPPDKGFYSLPGQEYTEAPHIIKQTFSEGNRTLAGQVRDRWGTWVSALIPVKDGDAGQVIAVLAVDYPAENWGNEIRKHVFHAIGVVVCIFLLITAIYWILYKNKILIELSRELKTREAIFRTIFEQSPFGIAIGRDYNLISNINAMFEKIMDRSKEELMSISWTEITHPDDIKLDLDNFKRFKEREIDNYSMIKRFIKPDDSYVWVNMKVAALNFPEENEQFHNHLCMIEDITERIKAEKALLESERSKSVLLSHLPGLAYRCSYDREWTMQFLSDGCYDLTGYKPDRLLYNSELSYNELIVPEYREILWNEWDRVVNLKLPMKYEYEIITAAGERKWVLELGQGIYNENGFVEALEGIIIDITEQKLREAKIRYMSDHDFLTGLYNRNYFEEEKARLDKQEASLPLSIIVVNINGVRLINNAFGHTKGDAVIKEAATVLQRCCRKQDLLARTGGDEFSLLMPNTSYEEAYQVIEDINNHLGVSNSETNKIHDFEISLAVGFSTKNTLTENINETIKEAENYMYNRKLLNRRSSHSSILSSIVAAMFARSQETEEHAQRIAGLAIKIGKKLELPQQVLDQLLLFSMLHDIGKVGIDDRILNKPGSLTADEWIIMKKHTEIGYRIAMASPELETIAEYILTHHEKWDGTGYPKGLKGEEIPLLSRILALADAYDAMTEKRIYRKTLTREEAIEEIKINAGTQFDPAIARIFIEMI